MNTDTTTVPVASLLFGGTGISRSQLSRLCAEINEQDDVFLTRHIEGEWPYFWIDATHLAARGKRLRCRYHRGGSEH